MDVEVALAPREAPDFMLRQAPAQEQGHRLFARAPDGQAPVLRMGGLLAELFEESAPRRAVVGAGVDQHAVHVEDDGVSHSS